MKLEAQDVIEALTNQRNGALNENVQLAGMVKALQREVDALKAVANTDAGRDSPDGE